MAGLLEGIRVLDFGRYIAGPYAAMMLADFGADVIRIERREGGEDRRLGPVARSGEGGLFLNVNRNKRGITLDPGHELGAGIVARLVSKADIVIVNLPFDVLQKLRLDYDSLRAVKPDIILVMASAFGPDGPYRDRVGFDGVLQAMSGSMALTGFPEAPMRSVVSWVDYGTALHGAFGAMAALRHRDLTGRGQVIDVSLLATSIMFMTPLLMEQRVTGIERTRRGNAAFYSAPSDAYRTRDGWILMPTISDAMFRRWARVVGREDLIVDPQLQDDISRADHYEKFGEAMSAWCANLTRDEATARLVQARIPCGPVYDLDEVNSDPQVRARELFAEVPYSGHDDPLPLARPAVRLSETPGQLRRGAPLLGEHTDEVLGEVGYSPDEIAGLRKARVI